MEEVQQSKFRIFPVVLASLAMLVSFLDWPYSYYILLKAIVTSTALYYAYYVYQAKEGQSIWMWILVGIAILFNPIIPVYLYDKTIWEIIDVIVIAFLIGVIIKLKKLNDGKAKIQNNQK